VVGPQMLDNILGGYNACLFAYGQTGSGAPPRAHGVGLSSVRRRFRSKEREAMKMGSGDIGVDWVDKIAMLFSSL